MTKKFRRKCFLRAAAADKSQEKDPVAFTITSQRNNRKSWITGKKTKIKDKMSAL